MQSNYEFNVKNPEFDKLGYIIAVANVDDKHDPSAPTNYHWKILKCRYSTSPAVVAFFTIIILYFQSLVIIYKIVSTG